MCMFFSKFTNLIHLISTNLETFSFLYNKLPFESIAHTQNSHLCCKRAVCGNMAVDLTLESSTGDRSPREDSTWSFSDQVLV